MADKTFPYKAVIFDMDGVIVDTEAYYQREQRRFVNEMGLNVSDQEILDLVGQSHQTFQRVLADWWSRAGRELTWTPRSKRIGTGRRCILATTRRF